MMQNTSHAVMAQRTEPADSPDDFPTPPWAARALLEHVLNDSPALQQKSCLEPACGAGHMARPLAEYFGTVHASDAYDYGYGAVRGFLTHPYEKASVDWVITNPPFRHSEQFVLYALDVAGEGVAILARADVSLIASGQLLPLVTFHASVRLYGVPPFPTGAVMRIIADCHEPAEILNLIRSADANPQC